MGEGRVYRGLGGRVSRGQRLRDEGHQAVLRLLYASQAERRCEKSSLPPRNSVLSFIFKHQG